MIINIEDSVAPMKRYRATVQTQYGIKHFDFGFKGGHTFIDGATELDKRNYWKRHMANGTEERLLENLIPSPSLLSAFLLWGKHKTLVENVKELNRLCKKSYQ
jgi:hypothetical protein